MARSFGATVVVLATIVVTMFLIRTLGQASRGNVDPAEVMMVLGYIALGHAPTILTLSLFISIVGTLSRMYRDSEMVIWFSSGRGLLSLLKPLASFAWPTLLVIALLTFFAWPWAHQQSQALRERFERRGALERIVPGQFQESSAGNLVFFIDKDSVGGRTAGEVFIAGIEKDKQTVTSARAGRIDTVGEDRFLILSNGQRLETSLLDGGLKLSEFEQLGILVSEKAKQVERTTSARSLSTWTLLQGGTPAHLGELSWRLGLTLAAINLVLVGVGVSSVNPRVGRNVNLVFALFTFILYYNLVNLGFSRISSGTSSFAPYMLTLHGSTFVLACLLLAKMHWNWTPVPTLRRRLTGGAYAAANR